MAEMTAPEFLNNRKTTERQRRIKENSTVKDHRKATQNINNERPQKGKEESKKIL